MYRIIDRYILYIDIHNIITGYVKKPNKMFKYDIVGILVLLKIRPKAHVTFKITQFNSIMPQAFGPSQFCKGCKRSRTHVAWSSRVFWYFLKFNMKIFIGGIRGYNSALFILNFNVPLTSRQVFGIGMIRFSNILGLPSGYVDHNSKTF